MTKIKLCGQQLKLSAPVIAADTIDYIEMAVDMSEDWQRMDAVFVRFELDNYYVEAQVRDGRIRKEQHLNLTRGSWRVSAYGVRSSGEDIIERITSTTASLDVKVTGAHGGEPLPPDPGDIVERLKAQIAGKLDKKLDAEDAGKVLGIDEEGNVVPVEGGGGDFFVVPMVEVEPYAYHAEIAFADVLAAVKANKAVAAVINGEVYPAVLYSDTSVSFERSSNETTGDRLKWLHLDKSGYADMRDITYNRYSKPDTGIPESDLSVDVQVKLNDRGGSDVTAETVKEWGFVDEPELETVTHKTFKIYPTFMIGGLGSSGSTRDDTNRCRVKAGCLTKLTGRLTVTPAEGWEFGVYYYKNNGYSGAVKYDEFSAAPRIVEQSPEGYYACVFGRKSDGSTITETEILEIDKYVTIELTVTDDAMRQVGDLSMYQKWAVCGASRDAGYVYKTTSSSSNVIIPSLAWGKISARNHGNDCRVYAVPSRTAHGFADLSTKSDDDARLKKLLSEEAKELYVVALGLNDEEAKFGTPANLHDTLEEYTDTDRATTWGALGYIILAIKAHAPEAHIIGILRDDGDEIPENHTKWVIANRVFRHFELPFADWFDADEGHTYIAPESYRYGNHPVGTGYAQMASGFDEIYRLMVLGYWSYFSHFTGYTYSSGGTEVTEATVAGWGFTKFDGDYDSLSNKPTIPAPVTDQHIIDVINAAYPNAEGVGF